jgi:hypothetical protein
MQAILRLLKIVNRLITETETAFYHIFPSLKNGELLMLPPPADVSDFVNNNLNIESAGVAGASSTLKPRVMMKRLLFFGTFLSVLFLMMAFSSKSFGQATVTSDADDYAPRSTATFTGAGFEPGESVVLKVKNLSYPCNTVFADSSYLPWTVTADENGGFVTTWLVCECPGDSLRLRATGQTSGFIAYAYFTDAGLQDVTVTATSSSTSFVYGVGGLPTYNVTVKKSGNNTALNVALSFQFPGFAVGVLPTGITIFGLSSSVTLTNSDVVVPISILVSNQAKVAAIAGFSIIGTPASGQAKTGTGTLSITPRPLSGTFDANDKPYDGTTDATVKSGSLSVGPVAGNSTSGIINGDNVSLSTDSKTKLTFDNKNVGTNKTVTGVDFILSGPDAANYSLNNPTTTALADITQKTVTASITAANKVYDGTDVATINGRTVNGAIGNDAVTLTGGTAKFNNKNIGTAKPVTGSGFSLSGTDAGNYFLDPAATALTTANITLLTITANVTVDDKVYDGGANGIISNIALVGVPNTGLEVVSGTGGIATFKSVNVGQDIIVNVTNITLTGADAGNYAFDGKAATTADITPKEVTGDIIAADKTYDGTADAKPTPLFTLSGVVGTDNVTLSGDASFSDKNVAVDGNGVEIDKTVTAINLTLNGSARTNYTLSNTTATDDAKILKKLLTFTVSGVNKVYDGTNTATISFNDDRIKNDVFSYSYTATFNNPGGRNAGNNKPITISGISISGTDAGNYTLKTPLPTSTTATISRRGIRVTAQHDDRIYDGTILSSVAPVVELTELQVGDVISTQPKQNYDNKNVGTNKTLTPSGMVINDGNSGNNYNIMNLTDLTGIIRTRPISVTAAANTKIYDGNISAAAKPTITTGTLAVGDVAVFSETYDNKNKGTGKTMTPAVVSILDALSANMAGNYDVSLLTSTNGIITGAQLTITANAASRQYSDPDPQFTVTYSGFISPEDENTAGMFGSSTLNFKTVVNATANPLVYVDQYSAPGNYKVLPCGLTSANYDITFVAGNFRIDQEDARVTYSGAYLANTSSPTSTTGVISLSATIQDITAVIGDVAYDTYAGDIRNAKVQFTENGNAISDWLTPGLIDPSDIKSGRVSFDWSASLGQHTIGIVVGGTNGYYIRNSELDDAVVNIYQASGDFITGGGYITLTNSGGSKSGYPGTKNNFGFNVKFNKGGTNLQGTINTIFRRMENNTLHVYQVKGNSMTSLGVTPTASEPTSTNPIPATFSGKASILDITVPSKPVSVDGNATLQVDLSDAGEPGTFDKIGISVFSKSGALLFSSSWTGTKTDQQTLAKGNLIAHSSSAVGSTSTTTSSKSVVSTVDPMTAQMYDKFAVKVFGNPSTTYFTIQVQSNTNEPVEIKIFDVQGRQVHQYRGAVGETFKVGHSLMQGAYFMQVLQGKNKSVTKLFKD